MALHLVGETLDRHRAFAAAQAGALVNLHRGIYVDATDDIDKVVLDHAVRIAAYLYPRAYLSGASAVTLAPLPDGRLFLSSRRNARTRIRSLEIIQNQAPEAPSTVRVIVGDDMGELHLTASSPRQRFLESFRQRSEHAAAVDPDMRRHMADRLLEEYGDADAAADALWALARANRWAREAELAEAFLKSDLPKHAPVNRAGATYTVAWHGDIVGRLSFDGAEWRWRPEADAGPPLIRETRPGSLPPFIEALLPEGWLAQVLAPRDERDLLRSGARYMSNIAIVAEPAELEALPADVLQGRLPAFQDNGLFTGDYQGPARDRLEDSFQQQLARLVTAAGTPRLSGVQIKAPMCLRADGALVPALDAPFTHILKPAGTHGFEDLPLVEWFNLHLARAAGFEAPEAALIDMPHGMPPALLVERFDIRRTGNDTRRLAMEDFCSVLDVPAAQKYDGTIERMGRGLRPLSTDPGEDIETLFKRALFAWLIGDGDMHLKNVALLKIAEAGADRFASVRLAPVYDAVTTRLFPGFEQDRMALRLNGKDDRLTPDDFMTLARTLELPMARAGALMAACARRLADADIALTAPPRFAAAAERVADRIRRIVAERTDPFV
jgi:serine/threonine-protein kinase HipA